MNLSTLAAEEADYTSGSLPVALYPNVMRRDKDGKQTFYARPIIRKHLSMEDIASDMVVEGVNGGMTREQIVSIWKNINCAVLDRVANSCAVDTGLCVCSTRISGSGHEARTASMISTQKLMYSSVTSSASSV